MLSTSMLYFREMARAGSLRRAAERLGIAPSAISRQIANLETELKVLLLDRRANRTTLTSAGELVFAHAEAALQESDTLRAALQEVSNGNLCAVPRKECVDRVFQLALESRPEVHRCL